MTGLRPSVGAAIAVLGGLAYWAVVSVLTGGGEPWDAPEFWTLAVPGAFVLSALLGLSTPRRAWAWGALVMLAQVVVVMVVSGVGPLLIAGLLYAAVLALPAMLVSWTAGRLRQRLSRNAS